MVWVALNLPVALLAPEGWSRFFRLNNERPADPDSVWNLLQEATDQRLFDGPLAAGESPTCYA